MSRDDRISEAREALHASRTIAGALGVDADAVLGRAVELGEAQPETSSPMIMLLALAEFADRARAADVP